MKGLGEVQVITKLSLLHKGVLHRFPYIMSVDSEDESVEALLKAALEDFEICRNKLDEITGRKQKQQSVNVSPSNPALENRLGTWCPRGKEAVGLRSQGIVHQASPPIPYH